MSFEFLVSKIKKNNFLLIGRAGIDIYPDPPGTKTENAKSFVTHLGGSSANMGVQLTLFGGNCNLLTRVSDDALGKLAINQLNHYGVKNKLVKASTILSSVFLDIDGVSIFNTFPAPLADFFIICIIILVGRVNPPIIGYLLLVDKTAFLNILYSS